MHTDQEILEAFEVEGTKAGAARSLGLTRSSFRRALKKAQNRLLSGKAEKDGFPLDGVSGYWVKGDGYSAYVKNDTSIDYEQLRGEFIESTKDYAPKYRPISHSSGDHLLIVDPADLHFNKLALAEQTGSGYNIQIAHDRLMNGIAESASKAQMFGTERIVYVLGNDQLHTDGGHHYTTKGTPQDSETLWWKAYHACKDAHLEAIETLSQIAPVHLVHCMSNHDEKSGWMLSDSIVSWMRNNPNVIIDEASVGVSDRKYLQYGSNLIGFTHGDGAKEADLTKVMQFEVRKTWGDVRFGTWYLHHLHHKIANKYGRGKSPQRIEKDHLGVTVVRSGGGGEDHVHCEVVRSPSGADSWHHKEGHISMPAIDTYLHHFENGPCGRFTTWCNG